MRTRTSCPHCLYNQNEIEFVMLIIVPFLFHITTESFLVKDFCVRSEPPLQVRHQSVQDYLANLQRTHKVDVSAVQEDFD